VAHFFNSTDGLAPLHPWMAWWPRQAARPPTPDFTRGAVGAMQRCNCCGGSSARAACALRRVPTQPSVWRAPLIENMPRHVRHSRSAWNAVPETGLHCRGRLGDLRHDAMTPFS
jgi:hypothetical protein